MNIETVLNLRILNLQINEDKLQFSFEDDVVLNVYDDGQVCCEVRFMHTDDNLEYFIGSRFLGLEVRPGPEEDYGCDVRESQFLIVTTSKGQFTVVTYNQHNGYYGGFVIRFELQ